MELSGIHFQYTKVMFFNDLFIKAIGCLIAQTNIIQVKNRLLTSEMTCIDLY